MTTHQHKCEQFKRMHSQDNILLLPNAWDAGTAVLMEQLGFPAIGTTSAGIAFANGYPDNEAMEREVMLEAVARIIERVNIPVSVDLESGYGISAAEVGDTVSKIIVAGGSGANIEDYKGKLLPIGEASERILAAKQAISNTGLSFVLNARTDCFLRLKSISVEECLKQTIQRAHAYLEAGADCIFVPGVTDHTIIAKLVKEINAPLNILGAYSGSSAGSLSDLQALGVKRVSIGGSLALLAFAEIKRTLETMKAEGTFEYASKAMTNAEMNNIMDKN